MVTIFTCSISYDRMHAWNICSEKGKPMSNLRVSSYWYVVGSYTTPFKSRQNELCPVINLTSLAVWFLPSSRRFHFDF